jgi:hypothetical protein
MARKIPKKVVTALIRAYQLTLSGWTRPSCKYYPPCSEYMIMAIEKYGMCRGIMKGLWRLLRCNPFSNGGYDPV